jgi:hypothetical protein
VDDAVRYLAACFWRYYGTDIDVRKFAAVGNDDDCVEFLKKFINVGVKLLILSPIPATLEHIENIWTKVIERVRL